jgi:pimeloyl-ACP methyl ester carboxylesterase
MSEVHSRDGTAIAFDRSGDGPPVILVGGALQHRAMDPDTARLAALLAPRFTVFHYDRRGRGDSGDKPPYAVAREVEDIDALIAEAGGSASVFGMSSGAALALEAAASGSAIKRLALYEPPFMFDGAQAPEPGLARKLSDLVASGRRGDAVALFVRQAGAPEEVIAQMRESPAWPALESVAHTLAYDLTIMEGQDALLCERAGGVDAPTLVVDGGASPRWARTAAEALAGTLPHPSRRTLEGQTHYVAPEALAPVVEEFFAS